MTLIENSNSIFNGFSLSADRKQKKKKFYDFSNEERQENSFDEDFTMFVDR